MGPVPRYEGPVPFIWDRYSQNTFIYKLFITYVVSELKRLGNSDICVPADLFCKYWALTAVGWIQLEFIPSHLQLATKYSETCNQVTVG